MTAYSYAGGLIGQTNNNRIENCYSKSGVTANGECGGLIGNANSSSIIKNCYAAGSVTMGNSSYGGLVGVNLSAADSVISSFWKQYKNGGSLNPDNGIGVSKTDEELSNISTYPGWSISANKEASTIWIMSDEGNNIYPYPNPYRFNIPTPPYIFPYLNPNSN